MSDIKVDRGIPIPTAKGKLRTLPMDKLKVGESFFIPGKTSMDVSGQVAYKKLKLGISVTMRTVDGGVRVWRTA